jgi:hypothetical protein
MNIIGDSIIMHISLRKDNLDSIFDCLTTSINQLLMKDKDFKLCEEQRKIELSSMVAPTSSIDTTAKEKCISLFNCILEKLTETVSPVSEKSSLINESNYNT